MEVTATTTSAESRLPASFWGLIGVALVLRLALIGVSQVVDHGDVIHPATQGDAKQYMDFGESFANGLQPDNVIYPHRDRLLPFLLGVVFSFTGRSIFAAQLLCATVAVLGTIPMYLAARLVLSRRFALLATGLWLFDPSFVGQSCMPLTENIQTPLIVLALWLGLLGRTKNSSPFVWASAGAMALAFFARSSTIALGLAVVIWLLCWPGGWRRRLTLAAGYAVVMMAAWTTSSYISYRLFGVFTPNTHTYSLWGHSAAKMLIQHGDAQSTEEGKEIRRSIARAQLPADATLAEFLTKKKQLDIQYIMQYPVLQLRNHVHALTAVLIMPDRWSIPAQIGIHRSGGLWQKPVSMTEKVRIAWRNWGPAVLLQVAAHMVFTVAIWIGVIAAVPQLWRGPNRAIVGLLILMIVSVISSSVLNIDAPPRYRLPAIPMMAILAAMSIQRWKRGQSFSSRTAGKHPPSGRNSTI
jgi:Dolichyl-phosphate-mannose-protein mannosyltransferase